MRISITVNEDELPERFRQVFKILPQDVWRRRAVDLANRERQNPHLGDYFDERYTIERFLDRALVHWSRRNRFPPVRGPDGGRYYQLYSFIHILSSVYPCLSPRGHLRVQGYLRHGLQSEVGLAAFAHELAVAVHLWSAGFDVEFTDIEERARFDILATKDGLHLEVDCKTASADVGRQIHRRRALELWHRINPILARLLKTGGERTVDIVLPGRLHGAEAYMNAVAKVVSDAIDQGKSLSMADIADVSLGEFDLQDEPFLATEPSQALERVVERLGRVNREVVCLGSREEHAAVVAIVSSREPDKVAEGIYRALKESAAGQFSGTNPVLLATHLQDLSPHQLRELASGPSALGAISNRLFGGKHREHLFGVAFVSPADMPSEAIDIYGAALSSRGTALLFRREDHPLSQDPRLVLFEHHDRPYAPTLLERLPFWTVRARVQQGGL
jgi:hypothetical protein